MSFTPKIYWTNDERNEKKTQWSNFWIMINTNQAGGDVFEQSFLITTLREAIDSAFGTTQNIMKILHVIDSTGETVADESHRLSAFRMVEKVESEAVVEVGPTVHRVHAHILLMVQHKTRVQLNVPALREIIREKSKVLGTGEPLFVNPIVRVKLIRENPLTAIRKYQRGYKGKIPVSLIRKVQRNRNLF